MSKFTSKLPTTINELVEALPKNSTVHGIALDPETKDIVILWENSLFESGLTVPVEYKLSELKGNRLPKNVYKASDKPKAVKTPPEKKDAPTVKPEPAKGIVQNFLNEEGLNKALADGKTVEFMGIEPKWKPYSKRDGFTNGFFYRVVDNVDVMP